MDQITSFFHQNFPKFSPVDQRPPPIPPSYRGTGGPSPRRNTLVSQSSVNPQSSWSRTSSIVIDRGLINRPGENNCFLNAAVQVLWHIDCFRRSFRLFEGHTCIGETCIFCALKVLFTQYQHSERGSIIPPGVLRKALANCYKDEDRFQLGLMDDAAECFEKLLEQIHYHLTGTANLESCNTLWCLPHAKFALTTVEQSFCKCESSEPLSFVEFVHYVTTSVIKQEYGRLTNEHQVSSEYMFDYCLHEAGKDISRRCQNRCGEFLKFKRMLLSSPDVVCIGLIWDSDCATVSDIMDVINSIGLTIHLDKIFDGVMSSSITNAQFNLTAMITYYGRHYSTFCYHSSRKMWIYFDDAKYRNVGSDWSFVKEECRKAHFQPLLLVYTNSHSTTIDTSNAPKSITKVSTSDDTGSNVTVTTGSNVTVTTGSNVTTGSSSTGSNVATGSSSTVASTKPVTAVVKPVTAVVKEKLSSDEDLIQFSISPSTLNSTKPSLPPKPSTSRESSPVTDLYDDIISNRRLYPKLNQSPVRPLSVGPTMVTTTGSNTGNTFSTNVTTTGNIFSTNVATTGTTSGSTTFENFKDSYTKLSPNLQAMLMNVSQCLNKAQHYSSKDESLTYVLYTAVINQLDVILKQPIESELRLGLLSKKHQVEKNMRQLKMKDTTIQPLPLNELYKTLLHNDRPINRPPVPNKPVGLTSRSRTPSPTPAATSPAGGLGVCTICQNARVVNTKGICRPCELKKQLCQ